MQQDCLCSPAHAPDRGTGDLDGESLRRLGVANGALPADRGIRDGGAGDPALEIARDIMRAALPLDVPLEVDLKFGENWEQMDRYLEDDAGSWRRVPKSAGDVAREEAEEEVAAELVP